MKTQSIALTIVSGLIVFGFLFFLIKIFSRKFKTITETESETKISYSLYTFGILIGGCILFSKAIPLIPQGFEIQWNQHQESFVLEALEFVATVIGFSFLWLGVIHFSVDALTFVIMGKRDEKIEMERNNFSFFLTKSIAFVGLSILASSIIENFLRLFMPTLDMPFYN
ncbi:MAG: hypothetical protein EOO50_00575 [Flavobacterium sp.]|uniref:hypothetical protein n=1 Tax=Flavobacterium sp. TaxID=239 RepID=UPI0012188666|nr:hypothetical protein [Flavobacterium sp.]RZJ68707.1 MAG: hypothetical protein EOO50_00575 [Flavobacterium sp.]